MDTFKTKMNSFSFCTLIKQWEHNVYITKESTKSLLKFEDNPSSIYAGIVSCIIECNSEIYRNDKIMIIEPFSSPSYLQPVIHFEQNGYPQGSQATYSLVHWIGLPIGLSRYNAITLRREDIKHLDHMEEIMKGEYANYPINWTLNVFETAFSKCGKNRNITNIIQFLMNDSSLDQDGIARKSCLKEEDSNIKSRDKLLDADISGFDLCFESAEYISECMMYKIPPEANLYFAFRVSPDVETDFLNMHMFDLNLMTHSGKENISKLIPLSEIRTYFA